MRRLLIIAALLVAVGAGRAEAVTVRDIIELSKTGLGDDILIALIEVERKVFPIDAATLKLLKDSGVSDRVIIAMVRSGRLPEPPPPAVAPIDAPVLSERGAAARVEAPPQVIVIEREPQVREIREVREVVVPVPVYVPIVRPRRHDDDVVGRRVYESRPTVPFSTIGLPHAPTSLPPIMRRKSDPPYWWEMQQPRRQPNP